MEILRRTLKAYAAALCMFAALTLALAAAICLTGFRESWAFAGLVAALSVSSLALGVMEGSAIGKRGMAVGAAAALVFTAVILCAVGGAFAEEFSAESLSPFYLIPAAAGALGGVFGTNLGK